MDDIKELQRENEAFRHVLRFVSMDIQNVFDNTLSPHMLKTAKSCVDGVLERFPDDGIIED